MTIFKDAVDEGWCLLYLDDVTIASANVQEHLVHLRRIMEIMRKNNLHLRIDKCSWMKTRTRLLGHLISDQGLEADPEKVEAMVNFPRPQNVKQVQSFLGMVNYYACYIRGLADIRNDLTILTAKANKGHRKKGSTQGSA